MTRRQCQKCPWRVGVDPNLIPNGYDPEKHRATGDTIATADSPIIADALRMMACHETGPGRQLPCVGWLHHQLGPGNNLALRLRVVTGRVDADVEIVGPQHARFEDTLPRTRRRRKS